jgi:hypothetical protein
MKTILNLQPQKEIEFSIQSADRFALDKALSKFTSIGLDKMDGQKLLDRVDTKFLFKAAQLPRIFEEIQSEYAILNIKDELVQPYLTLYYDTTSYTNYFDHHNGKRPRFKIRMRKYLSSSMSFLEIKEKNNKNHTIKTRMEIADITTRLSPAHYQFINAGYAYGLVSLKPAIWNRYRRVTLVNKHSRERVTIDLDYNAFNQNGFISWNEFAIAEIKQSHRSLNTSFFQAMKSRAIKPVNFSKYCISMALLIPQLKSNKFKPNIVTIKSSLQRRLNYAF